MHSWQKLCGYNVHKDMSKTILLGPGGGIELERLLD